MVEKVVNEGNLIRTGDRFLHKLVQISFFDVSKFDVSKFDVSLKIYLTS